MTGLEQFRLTPEGAYECRAALHRAQMASGSMRQITQVSCAVVRHRVVFEVTPDAFDGVELGCVGGQELKGDGTTLSLNVSVHEFRSMCLQAIPDDQKLLANRRLQRLQELDDLGRADRAAVQSEVKAPERHSSDHRELLDR